MQSLDEAPWKYTGCRNEGILEVPTFAADRFIQCRDGILAERLKRCDRLVAGSRIHVAQLRGPVTHGAILVEDLVRMAKKSQRRNNYGQDHESSPQIRLFGVH